MDEFEEFEEFFKPITSTQVQTDCPHCRIRLMQTETGLMCYTCGFVTGETVLVSTFEDGGYKKKCGKKYSRLGQLILLLNHLECRENCELPFDVVTGYKDDVPTLQNIRAYLKSLGKQKLYKYASQIYYRSMNKTPVAFIYEDRVNIIKICKDLEPVVKSLRFILVYAIKRVLGNDIRASLVHSLRCRRKEKEYMTKVNSFYASLEYGQSE